MLPDLMTALLELAAEEITACPGWDTGDLDPSQLRVLRYHGSATSMPPECANDPGTLVGLWQWADRSDRLGQAGTRNPAQAGWPGVSIILKWVTCWPQRTFVNRQEVLRDDEWDAASARIEAVMECVARALVCLYEPAPNSAERELLQHVGCGAFRYERATPIGPNVNVAGVAWQCYASLIDQGSAS